MASSSNNHAKLALTAASIALTVSGWAWFAQQQPPDTTVTTNLPATSNLQLQLEAIPTVAPLTTLDVRQNQANVATQPQTTTQAAAPAAPVLRSVSAPLPVARSRSSR